MMYVTAQPEAMNAAADRLQQIGTALAAQTGANSAPMTGVVLSVVVLSEAGAGV
ncbi:hypothetical protein MAHJHV61_33510 [Mycobacterium avium subsp. hominissuis]